MRYATFFLFCTLFLTGCTMWPTLKWPGWGSDKPTTPAGASLTAAAVERMAEIQAREAKIRAELEVKYRKSMEALEAAAAAREKADNDNFDRISEINFGIFAATEPIVDLDSRIYIANLKAQANMARLMPISLDVQEQIRAEIEVERAMERAKLEEKYKGEIKKGHEAVMAYEEAVKKLQSANEAHTRLAREQERILADVRLEAERQAERLKKEADDAIKLAKEAQRAEMLGWIVKSLLGVGVILLVPGFLMKSPTMIISGIGMIALSYVAATIPFWIVSSVMGLFILVMIFVNPKTGEIDWTPWNKNDDGPKETPPPTQSPAA